jgi:hypothetical protein
MYSYTEASATFEVTGSTFKCAFDFISWQPQVLVVQINMYDDDSAYYVRTGENVSRSRWFPTLMDVLRARVPPDCYVVCSTRPSHEHVEVESRHVDIVDGDDGHEGHVVRRPLWLSYVMLRAAKSMPRPSVFAFESRKAYPGGSAGSDWKLQAVPGGYGTEHVIQLPNDLDYRNVRPEALYSARNHLHRDDPRRTKLPHGSLAQPFFLDAWRREVHRRRPMPPNASTSYRASLRSWGRDHILNHNFSEGGMIAGTPSDLRVVRWWFLAVEHHGLPDYDDETDDDSVDSDGTAAPPSHASVLPQRHFYRRKDQNFPMHRWSNFFRALASVDQTA